MGTAMEHKPDETTELIEGLRGGDRRALAALFARYRDRLRRMVELRIDARVRARLDASDVVQEALNSLEPIDREVLALRHFEQLGRAEAAQVLGSRKRRGRSDTSAP